MPEKDGSDDKKSTKSVVSKKQKQFMNKEQLDLTSVAESFGGKIVGEPVELDEFKTTKAVIDTVSAVGQGKVKTSVAVNPYVGAGVAGWQVGKWLDKLITPRLNPLPKYKPFKPEFEKTKDGSWKLYTDKEIKTKRKELETKNKEKENKDKVIKYDMVDPSGEKKIQPPIKEPIKPLITTDTPKEVDKETEFKPEVKKDVDSKNIDNKSKTIIKNKSGSETNTNNQTKTVPLPLLTRIRNSTRTKTATKGAIPKLPRLPGTSHNVGRRVNPQ